MADDTTRIDLGFNVTPQEASRLQSRIDAIERGLKPINLKFGGGFGQISKDASQFTSYIDRANSRVLAFTSSVAVLGATVKVFKDIVTNTVAVDKALTDINSTMRLSGAGIAKFGKDMFDAARATSSSWTDAAKAAQLFARQGLSVEDTLKRTREAMTLAKIANIDMADAVRDLTEVTSVFAKSGLTAKQMIDSISAVSSRFAITASDLTVGFTRFGEVAQQAGLNFNQIIGLITSAKVTTQRDGAAIATALTNIFAKLEPRGTLEGLGRLGVAIKDAKGNILPMIQIVRNLADSFDGLSDSSKSQIDKLVGGARQLNILKGTLDGLSDSTGIYAKVQDTLANSTGNAERRLAAQNQSLEALIQRFKNAKEHIDSNVGNLTFAPLLRGALGGSTDNAIVKALEDATGHAETTGGKWAEAFIKGAGNSLLFGLGPILLGAAAKIVGATYNRLITVVKEEAGLNTESKEQAAIQQQINNLYSRGGTELKAQLALMTNITEKAAVLQAILSRQQLAGITQAAETAGIATTIRRRKAADGFLPIGAEQAAISSGVGGAPSSARPVVIPNFKFGAGQTGPIVANTSEYMVHNFAGGGSAIFNQDMIQRMGLPAGAKPIAAGGYVPNAAGGGAFNYGDLFNNKTSIDPFYGARKVDPQTIDKLNQLFVQLGEAKTVAGAHEFGNQIKDIAKSFDRVSERGVRSRINSAIAGIGVNEPIMTQVRAGLARAGESSAASPAQMAEYERIRASTAGQSSSAGAYLRGAKSIAELEAEGLIAPRRMAPTSISSPSAAGPGLFARLRGRLSGPNAGLAMALGLPLLGGMVSSSAGAGGSNNAALLGGLGGALTGAGTGASIGSIIPGIGTLVGGGIGGIIGGTIGALGKISKSYEELAEEIAQKNEKINKDYEKATEVFKLQGDLADAIKDGKTQGQINEIKKAQANAIGGIADNTLRSTIIGGLGKPGIESKVATMRQDALDSSALREELSLGVTRAYGSSSFWSKSQWGTSPTGQRITVPGARVDQANVDSLSQMLTPIIQKMSPEERENLKKQLATNPQAALSTLGTTAGLTKSQISELPPNKTGWLSGAQTKNFYATMQQAGQQALSAPTPDAGFEQGIEAGVKSTEDFLKKMSELSVQMRIASDTTQLLNDGLRKIGDARQQALLATSDETDLTKIMRTGAYNQSSIRSTFAGQRLQESTSGASDLSRTLKEAGISDADLLDRIRKAGLSGDFSEVQTAPQLNDKKYQEQISAITERLSKSDQGQAISLKVDAIHNELAQIVEKDRESTALKDRARFDPSTFSQIQLQSRLGSIRNGGNQSFRDENLLNEQGLLDSLGIPQTDASNSYVTSLKTSRAFGGLSQILGNRLGRKVGTSPAALRAAANSLGNSDSDQALKSRITTAIDRNDKGTFNPESAIDLATKGFTGTSEDLQKQLTKMGVGFDDKLLQAVNGPGGTNKLLAIIATTLGAKNVPTESIGAATPAGTAEGGTMPPYQVNESAGPKVNRNPFAGFGGGFQDVFNKTHDAIDQMSTIGGEVANSLQTRFGDMWDSFSTGAKSGSQAMRQFAQSITADASRAFANQAFQSLFSGLFNGQTGVFKSIGHANGGAIGLASGGAVPARVMGGEFYFGAQAARNIGYDKLKALNGYAGGGMITGGSGMRDDVPMMAAPGSFVVKKATVQRLGPSFLQGLANGAVRRADGGPIHLASGGAPSFATNGSGSSSASGIPNGSSLYINGAPSGNGNNTTTSGSGSSSDFSGAAGSFAASLILMIVSKLFEKSYKLLDSAGIVRNNANMVSNQQSRIDNRPAGSNVMMQSDGHGGYSIINFGGQAKEGNFSGSGGGMVPLSIQGLDSGGPVGGVVPMSSSFGRSMPGIGVKVDVHNYGNGNVSTSTQTQGGEGNKDAGERMGKAIQAAVRAQIIEEMRPAGLFAQNARYSLSNQVS